MFRLKEAEKMAVISHSATHHKVETISRSRGRSAVQIGAYISRSRSYDERTGIWHDHRAKGGIEASERVGWQGDGQSLWNAAEAAEVRRNSITARHTILALPVELSEVRQNALLRGYSLWLRDRYGVAVEWARHAPEMEGDPRNYHGHLVETTRRVDGKGRFGEKAREMDDRTRNGGRSRGSREMESRRAEWARRCNAELDKIGVIARIDHRSLERRAEALEGPKVAAKPRHMGRALTALKRRYEGSASHASQNGATPPRMPAFLVASRKRKEDLIRSRSSWSRLLGEVDDWLESGSPSLDADELEELLGTIIRAGTRTVRSAAKLNPVLSRPTHRMTGSDAIRLLATRQLQKKRTRHRGR